MLIEILSFAKSSGSAVILEQEYLQRLPKGFRVELKDLSACLKGVSAERYEDLYASALQGSLSSDSQLFILEEHGREFTSERFADFFQEKMIHGPKTIRFALAGPYGWGNSTQKLKGSFSLSLSPLTFPSHLARLILIEQIYRASTIINGKSYHK